MKSLTNSPVERLLKRFYGDFSKQHYFTFVYVAIEIGIHLDAHARPISKLNSYLLDFDFFFYLLVIGNSSTEEFKLYNLLKHSLVLSLRSLSTTSFVDRVCFREPPFRSSHTFSWKTTERIK